MKVCAKCKKEKQDSQFHRDPKSSSGLRSYCKECRKKYAAGYYKENAEAFAEYNRHRWHANNGQKASSAVNNAVQSGKMKRAREYKCATCGKQAEEYHHESYKKEDWLKVIPLCKLCHKDIHLGRVSLHKG